MATRFKYMLGLIPLLAAALAFKQRTFLTSVFVPSSRGGPVDCAIAFDPNLIEATADRDEPHGSRSAPSGTQPPTSEEPPEDSLGKNFDLSNLSAPRDQIVTLLPPDSIPALTDPKQEPAEKATWLPDEARVIEVSAGNEVLGVPLRVLDWHEIINTTVGGEPVAITYCPLCDSAVVFSRRVHARAGEADEAGDQPPERVLEFGVSGSLYNSNVLMYDRADRALWSQLAMRALSGPLAGTVLESLPVQVVTFSEFKKSHPGASIVSRETGIDRNYQASPYEAYFKNDHLLVPVESAGTALPRKTRGVGIAYGEGQAEVAWFVPEDAIGESRVFETPAGQLVLTSGDAGVAVAGTPEGVRTAQAFYFSWSAFYPTTRILRAEDPPGAELRPVPPGLPVGALAPDVEVTGLDGAAVRLSSLYKDGPIVLTFYRGGWCPICTRTLSVWAGRLDELKAAGGTFVALTPEKPGLAEKTRETAHADYAVFSDGAYAAAKAFKVHFVVDEQTKARYEKYGLHVAESNVSGTWELPAPATFIIDRTGVIRWAFADWDYQKRADPDTVIAAVKSLTGSKQ